MDRLRKLEEKARKLALEMRGVIEDDTMTTAEKVAKTNDMKADLDKTVGEVNEEKHLAAQRARVSEIIGGDVKESAPEHTDTKAPAEVGSLGEQFTGSAAYKSLVTSGAMRAKEWTSGAIELEPRNSKALLTTTDGAMQPYVLPGIKLLQTQPTTIASLIPSGNTTSNVIRHIREVTATNAADTVAEGAVKPESALGLGQVDEPVRKIATILPVTDEMLEDAAQIRTYIDNRLTLFVQIAEDDQLLNGTGVAPDLTGLMNRSGLQTAVAVGLDPDTAADAVHRAITAIRVNAILEPDGIVMHPTNWETFRLAKDANGQYYAGGPFQGFAPDLTLWGLRVVLSTRMTEGTALLGAFQTSAQIFRRGGIVVDATNSHTDRFAYNITTIRAEERLALAVYRPGGFGTVTGL